MDLGFRNYAESSKSAIAFYTNCHVSTAKMRFARQTKIAFPTTTENEQYKACVLRQVEVLSASNGGGELAVERATELVVSACKPQEDVYVVAMTDLAMTMTGGLVSSEKFLEDEEATLRSDLHDLAASLVSQNL